MTSKTWWCYPWLYTPSVSDLYSECWKLSLPDQRSRLCLTVVGSFQRSYSHIRISTNACVLLSYQTTHTDSLAVFVVRSTRMSEPSPSSPVRSFAKPFEGLLNESIPYAIHWLSIRSSIFLTWLEHGQTSSRLPQEIIGTTLDGTAPFTSQHEKPVDIVHQQSDSSSAIWRQSLGFPDASQSLLWPIRSVVYENGSSLHHFPQNFKNFSKSVKMDFFTTRQQQQI